MRLIFLGPPGAGKGTMAHRAKELLGVPHVSTGALFRENAESETPLGLRVKAIMERGDLVPDEITVAMVKDRLSRSDVSKGFILDGFPRTIPQAQALADITGMDHVVNLVCSDQELVKRLTGRRSCSACGRIYHTAFMPPAVEGVCDDDGAGLTTRDDDTLEAVRNRLSVYAEATAPLIDWYRNHGLLRDVDAGVPPDAVFESVRAILSG